MYVKIFQQIYDSSVCEDWQVMITFQQLLILCNQDGVADMTPEAISRRTNIPLEIIKHGIAALEQPDPRSRSGDMEGRRIVRLDAHRDWGWFIVNYQHYRDLAKAEEKREADRVRIAAKRAVSNTLIPNGVAGCRNVSQDVADVASVENSRTVEAYAEALKACAGTGRFEEFWQAYPRKENKAKALKAWKCKRLDAQADRIIADVKRRATQHHQWAKEGIIPHASTYLNNERWDDAIDAGPNSASDPFSGMVNGR